MKNTESGTSCANFGPPHVTEFSESSIPFSLKPKITSTPVGGTDTIETKFPEVTEPDLPKLDTLFPEVIEPKEPQPSSRDSTRPSSSLPLSHT